MPKTNTPVLRLRVDAGGTGSPRVLLLRSDGEAVQLDRSGLDLGCLDFDLQRPKELSDCLKNTFRSVFAYATPGDSLGRMWTELSGQAASSCRPFFLCIESGADAFRYSWEALIDPNSNSTLGGFHSPVKILRIPTSANSKGALNELPKDRKPWNVAVITVPTRGPEGGEVAKAAESLRGALRYWQEHAGIGRSLRLIENLPEWSAQSAARILETLQANNVRIVDVIAHSRIDKPHELELNGNGYDSSLLINELKWISSLQVASLSWCQSDLNGKATAATELCNAGVPAVITWSPKPWNDTLVPFHRTFYWAMSQGFDIGTAVALGRSSIASHLSVETTRPREDWLVHASAPRLYIHPRLMEQEGQALERLRLPLLV